MKILAVFLTGEVYDEMLSNIEGDINDQNIADFLKEQYGESLADVSSSETEIRHGFLAVAMPQGSSRYEIDRAAGYMGFMGDWVREGSWHGAVYM